MKVYECRITADGGMLQRVTATRRALMSMILAVRRAILSVDSVRVNPASKVVSAISVNRTTSTSRTLAAPVIDN